MKRMLIGVTGGIGSGKSTVSAYLRRRGEQVICADEVAWEITRPGGRGALAVRAAFGDAYFLPDGSLDRAKLARQVFGEPGELKRLNELLHPLILDSIRDQASKMPGRVFIDAALLVETGMYEDTDSVWVVTADRETRIRRVMSRDGATREAVEKRILNQTDDAQRMKYAHEVIDNSASLEALYHRIDRLLKKEIYNEVAK
jgi:dephospho-CoA kinase